MFDSVFAGKSAFDRSLEWAESVRKINDSETVVLATSDIEKTVRNATEAAAINAEVEFKNIDGKRTLCERPGTEKELPADLVLVAAGFLGCEEYTPESFGVSLTERNTVASVGDATPDYASPNGYKTSVNKVFTAGDMRRGQSLVVWAIAEGRECAREIDKYLMGYTNI